MHADARSSTHTSRAACACKLTRLCSLPPPRSAADSQRLGTAALDVPIFFISLLPPIGHLHVLQPKFLCSKNSLLNLERSVRNYYHYCYYFLSPKLHWRGTSRLVEELRFYSCQPWDVQNHGLSFCLCLFKESWGKREREIKKWVSKSIQTNNNFTFMEHPEWLSKILRHFQVHFSWADIYQKSFAPQEMLPFIVPLSQVTTMYDRQLQHLSLATL